MSDPLPSDLRTRRHNAVLLLVAAVVAVKALMWFMIKHKLAPPRSSPARTAASARRGVVLLICQAAGPASAHLRVAASKADHRVHLDAAELRRLPSSTYGRSVRFDGEV